MSEQDQIATLEAMLIEEREALLPFLVLLEKYARGVDMMARTAYMEAPAGSNEEANAGAIKQHTCELLFWINRRAGEMRALMIRALPTVEDDAPPMGGEAKTEVLTIH